MKSQEKMDKSKFSKPELTPFSISEFQRERDVIYYCFQILEDLGGDNGPTMSTLPQILLRIRKKIDGQEQLKSKYD